MSFIVLGLVVAGMDRIDSIGWWAASGALAGAFGFAAYVFVFRAAPEVLAVTVAAMLALGAIEAAWSGAYPGAALSQGLRVAVLFATALSLLYLWKPRAGHQASAPTTSAEEG